MSFIQNPLGFGDSNVTGADTIINWFVVFKHGAVNRYLHTHVPKINKNKMKDFGLRSCYLLGPLIAEY